MLQTSCPPAGKSAPAWIVRLCTALCLLASCVLHPCGAAGVVLTTVQKGAFCIEGSGSPAARIVKIDKDALQIPSLDSMEAFVGANREVIRKKRANLLDGAAVSKAWDFVFSDLLGFSSNAFTFFTLADSTLGSQVKLVLPKGLKLMEFVSKSPRLYPSIVYDEASMGTLVLKETRIGKLGNFMKNAGLIALAVQTACFMKDAAVGKDMKEDFYALVKSIGSNAVTLYGWAGLQVSMVGAFAIDYALTKFTEEARRLHKQGIGEIYREYTLNRRSLKDWEERLWTLLEKLAVSGRTDKFDVVLEHEVRDYCNKFWTDNDSPLYTGRLEKYPSKKEREELTAELTPEMQVELRRWLVKKGVFSRLQDRLVAKMRAEHAKQVEETAKILNAKGFFRVETSKTRSGSSWAGCTVWLYPDGGEGKLNRKWSFTLTDKGTGHIMFTLLGFFQYGFPTKAVIFGPGKTPGKDKPMVKCLFRMGFPETKLVLPEEESEQPKSRWNFDTLRRYDSDKVFPKYEPHPSITTY